MGADKMLDMTAYYLHNTLNAVYPVAGVSIGDPNDRSTWRIDFQDGTPDGVAASLQAALQSFDISVAQKLYAPTSALQALTDRISALETNVATLDTAVAVPAVPKP